MRICFLLLMACSLSRGQAVPPSKDRLENAIALAQNGSAGEAMPMLRAEIARLRAAHDDAKLARALAVASDAALTLGDYDAAVQTATEAAGIHERTGAEEAAAEDWNTAGRAWSYLARYQPAIDAYERALAIDRRRGDAEGEILVLENIANVYFEQGRYLDAYRQYQAALERVNATSGQAWSAHAREIATANLAILFQRLGRYQQALDLFVSLRSQSGEMKASERAQMLANLGTLYRRLGDSQKALQTYRDAQALFQKERHPFGESGVLKNIGIVLALDLGRLPEALVSFEAARHVAEKAAAGLLTPIDLYIGETLRQMGRNQEAKRSFEAALAGARQGGNSDYEWQALFGLGQIEEQAGDADAALRLYREAIARIESVRSGLELPVLRREFLGDKRQVYDAALEILFSRPNPSIDLVFDLMEHSRARSVQDRLAVAGSRRTLKDLEARLEPGTVVLEYWSGREGGAVLFVTREGAALRPLGAVDAAGLREAVSSNGANWQNLAVQAGRGLLADIPPLASAELRSVVVVPDGSLSLVPFEVLITPGREGMLIERAAVSYAPSASVLLRDGQPAKGWSPPWRKELLAFGDPAAQASGSGVLDPISDASGVWARLPMSAEEARAIARLLPGRAELRIGAEARKQYVMKDAASVPLLHVASHAVADYSDPERSRILFAPQEAGSGADFLFLREIYGLSLPGLDLVVLSACDTENGRLTGGEGVEGFAKAFLAAGAASAVTTLWPVEDRATAEFMKQFYYALASGVPKSNALRQAKLKFLRSGSRLAEPRNWAAFVLNGEGRTPIPRVLGWATVGMAAGAIGLALMATVLLFRARRGRPALTGSIR